VATVMLSIVFSGGLIPVTGRVVLDQLSWLVPARWGFAASASTIDLRRIDPTVRVRDPLWSHDLRSWLLAMGLLAALGMVVAVMVRWRLRLASLCRHIRRVAREPELTGRPSGHRRLSNQHLARLATAQHRKLLTPSDRAPMPSTSRSRGRHRARRPGRTPARGAGAIAAHRTPGRSDASDVRSWALASAPTTPAHLDRCPCTEGGNPMHEVLYERKGAGAGLCLNRPEQLNALNPAMMSQLAHRIDCAHVDNEVRALVIAGSGRAFCAGGDLTAARKLAGMDPPRGQQFLLDFAALLDSLQNFPKPRVTPAHDTDAA
jgi:hypothetical protein